MRVFTGKCFGKKELAGMDQESTSLESQPEEPRSSEDSDVARVEVFRAERDILLRETRQLEQQLKDANDQLLAYERSFGGWIMRRFWDLFRWFFPIGTQGFTHARTEARSLRGVLRKIAAFLRQIKYLFGRNGFVDVYGSRLDRMLYQDFLQDHQPRSPDYHTYCERAEPDPDELAAQVMDTETWDGFPRLTLITNVRKGEIESLRSALRSVQIQTFFKWQWVIVYAPAIDTQVVEFLKAEAKRDRRIILRKGKSQARAPINLNQAVEDAEGDHLVFLGEDDVLAPHALYRLAQSISSQAEMDAFYCDHDSLDHQGARAQPAFKPDWSPELMFSFNVMGPMIVVRRSLFESLSGFDESIDDAFLWDLCLRISAKTNLVGHIPEVLVHRRLDQVEGGIPAGRRVRRREAERTAVIRHLRALGLRLPQVEITPAWRLKVKWQIQDQPKVSIVIPSKDQAALIRRCLDSIFAKTSYEHIEVIVVDTGSQEPETQSVYEELGSRNDLSVVQYEGEFNFGKACNLGAEHASGSHLLFLNNDTEVIHETWLEAMLQWFELPEVGIVGAKLLFPDGRIQHAGVIIGMGGIAAHLFYGAEEGQDGHFGSDEWYRNVSAVTGASLLIRKKVFNNMGGFDEEFRINYSDVDLCLRVRQAGWRIVYTPDARLVHHEGASHQGRIPKEDYKTALRKLSSYEFPISDPYFNQNLSYASAIPKLMLSNKENPERLRRKLVNRYLS